MQRIILLAFFCLISVLAVAQNAPQGISYQAVLRNDYGVPIGDREIQVRVSILDPENEFLYYQESHQVRVAPEGTFHLVIGQGQRLDGNFRTIPWSVGQMWAEIEYDLEGRGQYQSSGAMQLLSVPYALYAQSAGSISDDDIELGADTRDDTQVVEKYWKTKGNELLPSSIAYFYPDSIINNQDIIPQFLGTTTMQPLVIRTGDTLRAFFLPVGDFYVLYDQYNLGDLEVRGSSTLWGHVVAKNGIETSVGQFFNVFVDNNVVIDNDLRVKRDAQVDRDVRIGRDLDVTGIARFNNTTQSTTKDNGAVIVEGGVGIEKNLNVGGNTSLGGDLDLGGKLTINDATESTATNNGALVDRKSVV